MHAPHELPPDLGTAEAYYELVSRDGDTATYRSTLHAQGAWNAGEQHMAPATGVLAHELTLLAPAPGLRPARLSLDIIGFIPGGEFTVTTRVVRPGRTIQLVEATMQAHGRTCIVARSWRLATSDTTEVTQVQEHPIPPAEQMEEWSPRGTWGGGYIDSLHGWRDRTSAPGHARAWLTNDLPMIAGEETPDLVKLLGMVDTANGMAVAVSPEEWAFPNVDLQIHLFRLPTGRRLGFETRQTFGADGVGLTSSILHDEQGPFGRSEQILTVRRMPGA